MYRAASQKARALARRAWVSDLALEVGCLPWDAGAWVIDRVAAGHRWLDRQKAAL